MARQYDPLSDKPSLMSRVKRQWWSGIWNDPRPEPNRLTVPRVAVLQHAMNTTPRPRRSSESIAAGYCRNNKLHDDEPQALWDTIRRLDSDFFQSYPRSSTAPLDLPQVRAVLGEAAQAFYKHGIPAYGKPGARTQERLIGDI